MNLIFSHSRVLFPLLFFIVHFAPAGFAQQNAPGQLNLQQAIETALANNPQINRALLSVDDAKQLVNISRSEVYPNISTSINYTRNVEIPVQFVPGEIVGQPQGTVVPMAFGTDNNWQGGFTVTQNIFKGDVIVALSTSAIFKTVQEENLRAVSQQVTTQTRIAYYQVLAAQEQLRLQQAQIRRLEDNLETNRRRYEAGLVDEYSIMQLEVQLSNQRPQLIEAEYALNAAYRNLNAVMGLPPSFEYTVVGNLNAYEITSQQTDVEENIQLKKIDQLNPYTYSKTDLTERMPGLRGDLRVLEASLNLKDKEILAIKSRFLPTVTASYNRMWTAAQAGTPVFFEDKVRFQTIGVNVSLPLFEGFRRLAEVQRANISRKDLEEQKRALALNAENEIAAAEESLNKAFETAEARKQALATAQNGYERALKRLENGIGSQTEVNDAELQVRQAEVNYAFMVFEYLSAKAQYDLATGRVPFVDIDTEIE